MLDQQSAEIEAEEPIVEEPKVEAEGEDTVAAEEPEIVVAVEGEEPEADPDAEVEAELGEAGKRALKAAREAQKETARKLREAEARAAELEAKLKPVEPEVKKPTLEECGWNEDVFAEKMAAYVIAEDKRKAAKAQEEAAEKAANDAYQARLTRYHEERVKLGVDDDAQARVVAKLSPAQQTAIMKYASDPTKLVAGLAKSPKMLDELSGITDIGAFIYKLPAAEGKITVSTKAPPPPESKLRGGTSSNALSLQSQLEAAEKKADATGDRTEVARLRRMIRAAGVKT